MQQHAETVDRTQPPRGSPLQQLRLQWHIDDIDDDGIGPQGRQGDIECTALGHAERGRVDQHTRVRDQFFALEPIVDLDLGAEMLCEIIGADTRAVEQPDLADPRLQETVGNGAGGGV